MLKVPLLSPLKQGLVSKCCLSLVAKVKSVALGKFDSSSSKEISPIGFYRSKSLKEIRENKKHQNCILLICQRKRNP